MAENEQGSEIQNVSTKGTGFIARLTHTGDGDQPVLTWAQRLRRTMLTLLRTKKKR